MSDNESKEGQQPSQSSDDTRATSAATSTPETEQKMNPLLNTIFSDEHAEWSYENQVILAPMVRVNTLPMRIMARQYGATMVYSEEIIAQKIIRSKRVVNTQLNTIDFVTERAPDAPVFRTYPGERVSFQMGTPDGVLAVKAAEVVCRDVRAIDVNMGCPKFFSIQGGMGVYLLKHPEKVKDIITSLKRNINLPITAKIRLLDAEADTINLIQVIEKCGVDAIGVHARFIPDRPRWETMQEKIPVLVDSVQVPILYNGDVFMHSDIAKVKQITKASSVMIARGAMWNASIFQSPEKGGVLPVYDIAKHYLTVAEHYSHRFRNSKYCLNQMFQLQLNKTKHYHPFYSTKTYPDLHAYVEGTKDLPMISGTYACGFNGFQTRPLPGSAEYLKLREDTFSGHDRQIRKRLLKQEKKNRLKKQKLAEEEAQRKKKEEEREGKDGEMEAQETGVGEKKGTV